MVFVVGVVVALGGLVTTLNWYSMYRIPSLAMSPTLETYDRIIVSGRVNEVYRGDIVVFDGTAWGHVNMEAPFVKRVVGVGGDTVECCDEQRHLVVNGRPVEEPYVPEPDSGTPPAGFSAEVPAGAVFVLGDNREQSQDSRLALDLPNDGAIPLTDVVGVVVAVLGTGEFVGSTSAFVDAGLPGGPRRAGADSAPVVVLAGGVLLILVGLVTLVIAKIRAVREPETRRAKSTR